MQITLTDNNSGCHGVLTIEPHQNNNGNNSDSYDMKLTFAAGQSFLVNDKEVTTIEFTVVGNWEMDSMLDLFAKMRELRKAGGL
jgi:hypothetical protein